MSLRPIKQIIQTKPTIEGAGVKLQRAFGFGNTSDFDPFLLFDDFRNENPDDYLAGFPWHPRQSRGRRRAVDDRRQRHPSSGNAPRRRSRPHARVSALGEFPLVAEDDEPAVPGRDYADLRGM